MLTITKTVNQMATPSTHSLFSRCSANTRPKVVAIVAEKHKIHSRGSFMVSQRIRKNVLGGIFFTMFAPYVSTRPAIESVLMPSGPVDKYDSTLSSFMDDVSLLDTIVLNILKRVNFCILYIFKTMLKYTKC